MPNFALTGDEADDVAADIRSLAKQTVTRSAQISSECADFMRRAADETRPARMAPGGP
jgi:hypothetical protein